MHRLIPIQSNDLKRTVDSVPAHNILLILIVKKGNWDPSIMSLYGFYQTLRIISILINMTIAVVYKRLCKQPINYQSAHNRLQKRFLA